MMMTELQIYTDYMKNGKSAQRIKALAEINDTTTENIKEIIMNQHDGDDSLLKEEKPAVNPVVKEKKSSAGRPKGSKNKRQIKPKEPPNLQVKQEETIKKLDVELDDIRYVDVLFNAMGKETAEKFCLGNAFFYLCKGDKKSAKAFLDASIELDNR